MIRMANKSDSLAIGNGRTDGQTNRWTDICDSRVAFMTEKIDNWQIILMILGLEDWQHCSGTDKLCCYLTWKINKFFYVLYLLAEFWSINNRCTLKKEILLYYSYCIWPRLIDFVLDLLLLKCSSILNILQWLEHLQTPLAWFLIVYNTNPESVKLIK